jgi:tetratricopeptide (TPR) repeat protein
MAFESAQKKMYFSARARFIEATRIIARSLDDQSGRGEHSQSLRVALQAYEEAADFFPQVSRLDQEVDLAAIVSGHNTQLLQSANPRDLTPRQCLREYMALAEQEFSRALKQEPLGSQALYGLGRLQSVADSGMQQAAHVRAHRSIMLFQTALRIDSNNFAAANELGVLLARYGQYPAAIASLQHSVKVSPQPAAWMNLARVHEKLGQAQEARLASRRAAELAGTKAPSPITLASRPQIQWVDARTFARVPDDQAASQQVVNKPTPRSSVPQQSAAAPEKKKLKPWFWRD